MNSYGSHQWRLATITLFAAAGFVLAAETNVPNPTASLSAPKLAQRPAWQQRFTLGPGDVLNFSLVGSPEFTRENIVIGPDGRVNYLQAQDVLATGLTVDELRGKIDSGLDKFYRAPRTVITPVSYNSKSFVVLGAVVERGTFKFDRPLTVVEAVGRAGGFQTGFSGRNTIEMADLQRSVLVREGERVAVDFEKLFQQGDLTQNAVLQPDDYLYFPPANLNQIYVLGAVSAPGAVTFTPNVTAIAAISERGGFTERAWRQRILVVRGSLSAPQTFVLNTADMVKARAPDFVLQPKDIVYVHERPWILAEDLVRTAISSFAQGVVVAYTGRDIRLMNPYK